MEKSLARSRHTPTLPEVKRVGPARPFFWLRLGWEDLRHHPGPSIAHGSLLAAVGWLILSVTNTHIDLVAAAISGFLVAGPIVAAAFYELSRRRAAGQPATFDASVDGAIRNGKSLIYLGLVLAVLALVWAWLSRLLFEQALGRDLPSVSEVSWQTILSWDHAFFVTYLATGAVLALIAFVLSAVSAPIIFDHRLGSRDAVLTSIKVVRTNPAAMAVWAVIVGVLTAIGFATFLLGLVIVLPLLGHATWHAYRDLVP